MDSLPGSELLNCCIVSTWSPPENSNLRIPTAFHVSCTATLIDLKFCCNKFHSRSMENRLAAWSMPLIYAEQQKWVNLCWFMTNKFDRPIHLRLNGIQCRTKPFNLVFIERCWFTRAIDHSEVTFTRLNAACSHYRYQEEIVFFFFLNKTAPVIESIITSIYNKANELNYGHGNEAVADFITNSN